MSRNLQTYKLFLVTISLPDETQGVQETAAKEFIMKPNANIVHYSAASSLREISL